MKPPAILVITSPRRYRTVAQKRRYAERRRKTLREQNLCINAATHGVLCQRCRDTHRRSQ